MARAVKCSGCLWWIQDDPDHDGHVYGACAYNAPTAEGFPRTHEAAFCRMHSDLDQPESLNQGRIVATERDDNGRSKRVYM